MERHPDDGAPGEGSPGMPASEQVDAGAPTEPCPPLSRLAPGEITGLLRRLAETPGAQEHEVPLQPGEVLGRFLVERVVGRGGFGRVYEAKDLELSRKVALKVIGGKVRLGAEPAEWTRREGEAVARLNHPAIVTLHDAGRSEGRTWLVYELLDGHTLDERLREGPPPPAEARRIVAALAEALAHAHAHGVVHRDLKPSNVMVDEAGRVKVLDFGLAQVVGAAGLAAGSPPYVAPEQWRGEPVDARADVYAWGMLAWALLGGGIPATGKHPGLPERRRPTGALARLAEQARSEDPRARPADGAALVARLGAIRRRSRWLRGGAAAAAAVAVALALAFWPRTPPPPPGPFKLAVSDADNRSGEPALDGLGALVATQLEASPRLAVLGRTRLAGVLRASGRAAGDRLDGTATTLAANLAGAAAVLVPAAERTEAGYTLEVVVRKADSGEELFSLKESAPGGESVMPAVERLVRRVRERLRDREPEVRSATAEQNRVVTTSLEAYRHYFDGIRCQERATQDVVTLEECRIHFQRALDIDPDFPQAHLELARESFWNGETRDAQRALLAPALARLDRVPPRARPPFLAWKAWLDGDEAGAFAVLARAEADFPDDARLALALGDLAYRVSRFGEAVGPLSRALELDPGLDLARDMLVWSLGVLGREAALRQLADQLARQRPTPTTLYAQQQARGWLGEHATSVTLARRIAAVGAPASQEALVEALAAAGAWDEAETLARGLPPDPPDGRHLLGQLLILRGRVREARPLADPALPASATAQDRYVRAVRQAIPLFLAGDAAAVRRLVEQVRATSPELAATLASGLAYAGDVDGAAPLLERLAWQPSAQALLEAMLAWRRDGAAAALPKLRALQRGEPLALTEGCPPELISWFVAEAALEAEGPAAALDALRRFERYFYPLGFGRVWILPRALVLEARLLDKLGRRAEARAALARFEALWRRADPDLPLLAEARALRRTIGPGGGTGTGTPAGQGK